MAIENTVSGDFDPRFSIVNSVFDCHPPSVKSPNSVSGCHKSWRTGRCLEDQRPMGTNRILGVRSEKGHNELCYSYTMGCPLVRGDNPRALASGLSYVLVDKHGITILYHQH